MFQLSSVQSLSRVRLFATPWTAARQATLSINNSRSLPNSCSLSRLCHPTISSSVTPFSSCPQYFPGSGSFAMSWLFASSGQSIRVSALVFPINIQGWFSLGLTGFISLQSKGLSKVFSYTTVWKCHNSLTPQFENHWRRKWQPIPIFLPGEPCEQYKRAKQKGYVPASILRFSRAKHLQMTGGQEKPGLFLPCLSALAAAASLL